MPKRPLFALGILVLILAACKSAGTTTPAATATPSPTPNPTATTATVMATYNGNPYSGTIYANEAASGCPGSTTITGSTLSAPTGNDGNPAGTATLTPLVANTDYEFFYVVAGGPTVSICTINWTYGTVSLSYP